MLSKSYIELHATTLQKQWMGLLFISSLFALNVSEAVLWYLTNCYGFLMVAILDHLSVNHDRSSE